MVWVLLPLSTIVHIHRWHRLTAPSKNWQRGSKRILLEHVNVLLSSFFHVTLSIFLRRCPWYLFVLRDKGRLKLFDFLRLFDNFALDFRNDFLVCLWDVLLGQLVREERIWIVAIEGRPWNLWSALHF